jgi:CubicO group peptidase (beta-lactamase class C family)
LALLVAALSLPAFTAGLPTPATSPGPAAAHALVREDLEPWLDGLVPVALRRGDVAGAVVVVVKDGQVLLQKGYGYADMTTGRPVDPQTTLFRPGSVSKLFTWTAVMQLVEQARIDLDRDINTYLDFTIPPFEGKPITLRHLMTHTAGFQDSLKDLLVTDSAKAVPLATYVQRQLPARVFAPGEVPSYSNYGTALAGYIVQRVAGQPFEAYMQAHVLAPLGMRHTSFAYPVPTALAGQLSNGYELASEPPRPFEIFPAPAGNAVATGADMARFMIAHLQDGQVDGQRILQPATARLMHDTALTVINPQLNRMLLGFFEFNRNGRRIIGHEGATRLFMSLLNLWPDDRVGLFVSFNSVGRDGASRAIRSALAAGFADRYFPDTGPRGRVAPEVARAHAALLAGSYDSSSPREEAGPLALVALAMQTQVTADGDGRITASSVLGLDGQPRRFEEVAPWVWQEVGGQTRLAAKLRDGRVVMWGQDTESPAAVFLPTPAWRDATWLAPLLAASLTALLATAALWPVGALVRRHFGAPPRRNRPAARALLWARLGATAAGLLMLAWLATIAIMVAAFYFSSGLDPWLMALHLLTIAVFPLAAFATLRNAWVTWRAGAARGLLARLWSGVVAVACGVLLWVAWLFHLIGFSVAF